ncbi:DUF2071 domain-containing protein [uncultured Algibacter sp.]|uniref:DUF2071 domain-containing protein n=1 Tax=uncultured Algibacter sp. TaxID=298659 RepID=UPI0026170720|nr:DUF2071 domain-containing protein [uncultured Algibacter sp.]
MLSNLKKHPFTVEAFFKSSIVLTFAVPKQELEALIPECLELDTFNNKWSFIAVAMVQTKNIRPKGFPACFGNDLFLIGYRIFVRYKTEKGKRLRGLYILKSETDKKRMAFAGNLFTHYNYTSTDISCKDEEINSIKSNFKIKLNSKRRNITLPNQSPFSNLKEARRFAGPLPFTFTYNEGKKEVLIIEGVRQNWKPNPVHVEYYNIAFLDELKLKDIVLANAFKINNIPYYWKKGRIDLWN